MLVNIDTFLVLASVKILLTLVNTDTPLALISTHTLQDFSHK